MVEGFVTNNDKLEFKGIVLKHLQDILRLSQVEWKGGYNNTIRHPFGNGQFYTTEEYISDSREVYTNAVVSFSDILQPHFDKIIKPKYDEYIKILDMTFRECYIKFEKEFEEEYKDVEHNNELKTLFCTQKKLRYAQKLFRELNLLLHRIDYLKTAVFGEGMEEDEDDAFVEVDK